MLAVLGGTFDPIHNGHLHLANQASAHFGNTPIQFVLAARPRLRDLPIASVEQRWAMLNLACEDQDHLRPNDLEIEQPGLTNTLATAKTLYELHDQPVCWIVGSDSQVTLESWVDSQKLPQYINFVVAQRPGIAMVEEVVGFEWTTDQEALTQRTGLMYLLEEHMLDLSATEVRRQAANGMYLNGLVPYSVYRFMHTHSIYLKSS